MRQHFSIHRWALSLVVLAGLALSLPLPPAKVKAASAGEPPTARPPRDAAALERLVKYAKSEGITFVVSIKELAKACEEQQAKGAHVSQYLRRLKNLNILFGFAILKNDIVLLGINNPARPHLYLDDLAHTIQAVWNDRVPKCSLEPDEKHADVQRCVIGGVPSASAFADSLIAGDYVMKQLAMGTIKSRLPGLKSFFDLAVANQKKNPGSVPSQMNRWWFTRPPIDVHRTVVVDEKIVLLTKNPVVVLTEREVAGKKWGTGETGAEAQDFAITLTFHLNPLADTYPAIGRLMALFQLHDLVFHIRKFVKSADDLPGKDFWINRYRSPYKGPPLTLPTLTRTIDLDDGRLRLSCSGGVDMAPMKASSVSRVASADGVLRRWLQGDSR